VTLAKTTTEVADIDRVRGGVGANPASGRRVLLVHGRDFKPPSDTLLHMSRDAIVSGLRRDFPDAQTAAEDLELELAWYGDLSGDVLLRQGRRYDERLDVGDRHNALKALKQLTARKRFGIHHYDRLPGKSALKEFVADTALPVLAHVGMWHGICRRHAPDFAEYLRRESEYAAAVRDRVRARLEAMFACGDRILLLTHGTGSVVAWDVLWQLSQENVTGKVDLWVTTGSPLGDTQVRRHILGADRPAGERFPTNVISWCNVSAEDDFTCHDKTLANDYRRMLDDRLVSVIRDFRIYNHAVRYGRSNPHSSVGYLIHPRLSRIVADWLGVTPPPAPAADEDDD
jgi:hypothetical protein